MKLLAIDVGASSGRAMLGDLHDGTLTLTDLHRFDNAPVEKDGHKHWGVTELGSQVYIALTKAGADVRSVGIDTWGVDYGYLGKVGQLVALPFAYRDERTQGVPERVHRTVPFERIYEITGIQYMPINTIYQMADDAASRPEVLRRADRMLMMPELLSHLLTGEYAAEYSIASTSALVDARARTWSDELIAELGLPRRLFGDLSRPGEFRAPVQPEVRRQTRCRADVILPGCHDTASAVAATPLPDSGAMYISSGTWSLAGMELEAPLINERARENNFTNEGGVAGTIRLLKNVMGLWLVQELRRLWAEDGDRLSFAEICDRAEQATPFAALIDPNRERFLAPDDMRAEIRDECARTGQPAPDGVGPLARTVFESLALAYRECLDQLRELTGEEIDRVHVVGGGVQNELLCQMTANACGVPVYAGPVEATAIGNLLVQAIALGELADLAAARQIVRTAFPPREYAPQETDAWLAARERYTALPSPPAPD
ncbi:MAG: rhamnulokinase family protein [Planctomycetota bacterium]